MEDALSSVDILPSIFKFLSSDELFRVSRVCKVWHNVILSILGKKAYVSINLRHKSNQPVLLDFNRRLTGYMLKLRSFRPSFSIIILDEEDYDEGYYKYISSHSPGSWVLFHGKFRTGYRLSASLFSESFNESINDYCDFRFKFNYWICKDYVFDHQFENIYPAKFLILIQEENSSSLLRRPESLDDYFIKTNILEDPNKQFVKVIVEKTAKYFGSRTSEVSLYATLSMHGKTVKTHLFPLETSASGWPNFYFDLLAKTNSHDCSSKLSVYAELVQISKSFQSTFTSDIDCQNIFALVLVERQYKEVGDVYSHWFPSFCAEFLDCFKKLFPLIECHILPVEEIYLLTSEKSVDRCCRSSPIMLTFTYFFQK